MHILRKIINKKNHLLSSQFVRQVLTLLSGASIAQALPILVSPLLTRLYSPEAFGLLAVFMMLVNVFTVASSAKYEQSIMLADNERDANHLMAFSIWISLGMSVLLMTLFTLFNSSISRILNAPGISPWLYVVPAVIFFRGIFQIFEVYSSRQKRFRGISVNRVLQRSVSSGSQVGLGFLGLEAAGLILSSLAGSFIGAVGMSRSNLKSKGLFKNISRKHIWKLAGRFKKFPKYTLPGTFINTMSFQLPVFLLTSFFSSVIVGFYSLADRILMIPMRLLGRSVSQVFYQRANEYKNDKVKLSQITYEVYKKLLLTGIIPLSLVIVFGDHLFGLIFGEQWYTAGQYAQVLGIWVLFNFISSPMSRLFVVLEKQEKSLVVQIVLFFFRLAPFLLGVALYDDALQVLMLYAMVSGVFWLGFCFYLLNMAGVNLKKAFFYTIFIVAVFLLPLAGLRILIFSLIL
ncbi:MAG: oligosaccharide flippase family protein [Bacteroidales bacterium]|nr:oligosaccharide flippase family protein [Bacteroidales bacterium]